VGRTIRTAITAAGTTGLLAASLLGGPAMAANASQAARPQHQTALPLSARQMRADRNLHLRSAAATGAITGSARAADGQPLAGVCVLAYGPSGRRFTSTRPDGRYLLTGLKPGAYQVRYFGCGSTTPQYLSKWYGGSADRASARQVEVSSKALRPLAPVTMRTLASESPAANVINPASQATITRSLQAALGLPAYGTGVRPATSTTTATVHGGRIAGVVTSPSGHGLAGICVETISNTGNAGGITTTGRGGRYLTTRLPAGGYIVLFFADCGNKGNWVTQIYKNASPTKPTVVGIRRGKTTTGINARLKLGGEITGTIKSQSGARLSDVCVAPVGSSEAATIAAVFVIAQSGRGTYQLRGLPTGSYKLIFEPCGLKASPYASVWWPRAQSERSAKSIKVAAGKVRRVNAVLPLGGVISGTVTSQASAPLAGICVDAQAQSGLDSTLGIPGSQPTTNAAGHYEIIGLDPSSYQVQFQTGCGNDGNFLPATYAKQIKLNYGKTAAGVNVQLLTGSTLSGTVTSAATGKPVKGICVDLSPGGNTQYFNPTLVTGAAGTYTFDQMPAGTYYAQFVPGCGNSGSYAPQGYDDSNVFLPQVIKVTAAGQTITGINAALQPGATITGTVTGPHGSKLTGMCAVAGSPVNGVEDEANSKNGRYTMGNMLPGQYEVYFTPGCNNNADLATVPFGSPLNPPVVSAPAGTTSGIDGKLPAAGNISGTVRTRSGRPVELSCATVTGLSRATEAYSGSGYVSSTNGKYEITELPPGPYQVYFQPGCFFTSTDANQWYKDKPSPTGAARIQVRAGRTTSGITAALVGGGSIAGRVTEGGKPVNGVCVFAQSVTQFADYGSGTTNRAGRYVVRGLNSGKYELSYFPCAEGSGTLAEQQLQRLIKVTGSRTTNGANTTMVRGGSVSGSVLGSTVVGGTPTVQPQPGICVDAIQTNGFGYSSALTGANGDYKITNLPAGRYQVYIGDTSCGGIYSNLAAEWYPNAPTSLTATVLSVSAGKVTTLASDTLPTNGAIAGTVTGSGSTPVAGICVTATSAAASFPVVAVTGANGGYSIAGLAPGGYQVEFSSGCGASGYRAQWWKGKSSAATATTVEVAAATTATDINASMQK
jgi:carboxypeptidase family protein